MKKIPSRLLAVTTIFLLLFLQFRCSKSGTDNSGNAANFPAEAMQAPPEKIDQGSITPNTTAACGGGFSGRYAGSGYYTYPIDNINVACLNANSNFFVVCNSVEVPNRFTVYDANGNFVASTGWIGYATYAGPWGGILNGPSTKTLTIPKTGTGNYTLRVETSTGPQNDAWDVSVSCTCPNPAPCTNCPGCNCGTGFSGTYTGYGYYNYPAKSFDLSCLATGKLVTVYCNSVEVPNRFNIYDASGSLVASTGWIGYATYPGPWGGSLNGPGTKYITFTKGSSNTYTLRVETSTGPQSDAWDASISCTP